MPTDNEIRQIEGYEVIHAVKLAGAEVILAENKTANEPFMVCDCSRSNILGIDEYKNAVVSADFLEIMNDFTTRLATRVELLETERSQRDIPLETLTAADCLPKSMDMGLEGHVVVLKPDMLAPEYRSSSYQLALCTGGFGSRPNARGRAVYCTELYDGNSARFERSDIAGIILPERLPDWAKERLAALQKPVERNRDAGQQPEGEFSIYQLKRDDSTRGLRFEPFDGLKSAGISVNRANYELVYTAQITADTDSFEKIYAKFNTDRPEDFKGHSLSVSDVLVVKRGEQQTAHYVDSAGFKEIPGFLQPVPQKAEKESVVEKIKQDRQAAESKKPMPKSRDKSNGTPEL